MRVLFICLLIPTLFSGEHAAADVPLSSATETCLTCHEMISPGTVAGWRKSLHAAGTPKDAMGKASKKRRISVSELDDELSATAVGCAECHMLDAGNHQDTFEHFGYDIHVVVTPRDCARCHPVEAEQYDRNIMSRAYGNLMGNPLYLDLVKEVNGLPSYGKEGMTVAEPDDETNFDSCLHCHGTAIGVKGTVTRETEMGEMEAPVLSGWPNQGVGRLNPDGSRGACTSCHPRHRFSIATARDPHTCSECHKGPDVPAFAVYKVSKHGNIFSAHKGEWNLDEVPWKVGTDFTAPTCAACHVSLITDSEGGEVIAERTHRMNDRLPWRIFGPIYAHAHPKSPDTSIIRNRAGLPLPTELTGEPAADYLIDEAEFAARKESMARICLSCHGSGWVEGHFRRLENTVKTTNEITLTATKLMLSAWDSGAARGLSGGDSIFNEAIERKWVELWLFHANSVRFASAMSGADYGVFAGGRWQLRMGLREMAEIVLPR